MPGALGAEEAFHALRPRAFRHALQGALGDHAGRFGAFRGGGTEEHRRADEFVVSLFRPKAQQLELLPVVGRLDTPTAYRLLYLRFPLAPTSRGCSDPSRGRGSMAQSQACRQSSPTTEFGLWVADIVAVRIGQGVCDGLAGRSDPTLRWAACLDLDQSIGSATRRVAHRVGAARGLIDGMRRPALRAVP
jgi:hypothetical protein